MRLLLAGELGSGALTRSLHVGLATEADVVVVDPSGVSDLIDRTGMGARVRRRLAVRAMDERLLDAARDHHPDALVIVKGRGVTADGVTAVRRLGVPVLVYYPDNPWWLGGDTPGALERLKAADRVLLWSERLAERLRAEGAPSPEVLPFGYDARWYGGGHPDGGRSGVVFLGTWSRRRQRFLEALAGLPLTVRGTGWPDRLPFAVERPTYEAAGGDLLRGASIGVNLLHPQCAGAHNMRTREIAASGAFQVTEPGTDGTPFRDGDGCAWFRSPDELRAVVERWLGDPDAARAQATGALDRIAHDTYAARGRAVAQMAKDL